ncbi:MAG: AtpZ/AtpI family protein [Chloroflexota bacterium]
MTQAGPAPDQGQSHQALRLALMGVVGQVGCLTLVIVLVALGAGLWLDSRLNTRPLFALILVLGSIPVTLYLMVRIVLSAAPRLQVAARQATRPADVKEEPEGGKPSDSSD